MGRFYPDIHSLEAHSLIPFVSVLAPRCSQGTGRVSSRRSSMLQPNECDESPSIRISLVKNDHLRDVGSWGITKAVDGRSFVSPNPPSSNLAKTSWSRFFRQLTSVIQPFLMLLNNKVKAPCLHTQNISLFNATQSATRTIDTASKMPTDLSSLITSIISFSVLRSCLKLLCGALETFGACPRLMQVSWTGSS
jgi:hypothetical protein